MTDNYSDLSYLGKIYQLKLLYNIIWDKKFANKYISDIYPSYFDDINFRFLYTLIKGYHEKYNMPPNVDNIEQIIQSEVKVKVEQDMMYAVLNNLSVLKRKYESGEEARDTKHIKDTITKFIQRQEYKKVLDEAESKYNSGDIEAAMDIPDLFRKVLFIGEEDEQGRDVHEVNPALFDEDVEFRAKLGLTAIDHVTLGVPRKKLVMFLAGQGVGKSRILAKTASELYFQGLNVLHAYFDENTDEEAQGMHYAMWSGVPMTDFKEPGKKDIVLRAKKNIENNHKAGKLILQRFSSDGTTVPKIRNFIEKYQEANGFVFDAVVIDYIDEIEYHKPQKDFWTAQAEVAKCLHSMLVDLDMWGITATQGKKEANDERYLTFNHCGGSVGKLKKAQLVIAIGSDAGQKEHGEATFSILKSNISPCGHIFDNVKFNRGTLEVDFSGVISGMLPPEFLVTDSDDAPQGNMHISKSEIRPVRPNPEPNTAIDNSDKKILTKKVYASPPNMPPNPMDTILSTEFI
jgi:hypothetical protein